MLSHPLLGTNKLLASRQFYDAMLGILGAAPSTHTNVNGYERHVWDHDGTRLMIATPHDGEACTTTTALRWGSKPRQLRSCTRGVVVEDAPGWRKAPGNDRYLVYVRDPASEL